jgi:hypothetical protein
MTTSVAAHDEPPLGPNVTTGRRKTVADGRLRRNFWSAKETAELITEMMSMQKGAYFLFYFLVCNCRIRVCGVRCAVCGVRCAVCGVRCAVCGVRCAVCGVVSADWGRQWKQMAKSIAGSCDLNRTAEQIRGHVHTKGFKTAWEQMQMRGDQPMLHDLVPPAPTRKKRPRKKPRVRPCLSVFYFVCLASF